MSNKYLIQIIPENGKKIKKIQITSFSLKMIYIFIFFFCTFLIGFIAFFSSFFYLYESKIECERTIADLKVKNQKIFEIENNLHKMSLLESKLKRFINTSDVQYIDIDAILSEDNVDNYNIHEIDYEYLPNIIPLAGWITVNYNRKNHPGIDIAAELNTPYVTAASGTVYYKGESDVFGKYIIIEHRKGFMTKYSHSSDIIVEEGEIVTKGQLIGYIGKTGSTSGSHLHYEILKDGKNIDPVEFINGFNKTKIEE